MELDLVSVSGQQDQQALREFFKNPDSVYLQLPDKRQESLECFESFLQRRDALPTLKGAEEALDLILEQVAALRFDREGLIEHLAKITAEDGMDQESPRSQGHEYEGELEGGERDPRDQG